MLKTLCLLSIVSVCFSANILSGELDHLRRFYTKDDNYEKLKENPIYKRLYEVRKRKLKSYLNLCLSLLETLKYSEGSLVFLTEETQSLIEINTIKCNPYYPVEIVHNEAKNKTEAAIQLLSESPSVELAFKVVISEEELILINQISACKIEFKDTLIKIGEHFELHFEIVSLLPSLQFTLMKTLARVLKLSDC